MNKFLHPVFIWHEFYHAELSLAFLTITNIKFYGSDTKNIFTGEYYALCLFDLYVPNLSELGEDYDYVTESLLIFPNDSDQASLISLTIREI